MARPQRFFDPSQPQTLQIATFLLYLDAAFAFLGGIFSPVSLLVAAAYAGGAYGVANGKKWGYGLAIVMAFLPFVPFTLAIIAGDPIAINVIALMFDVALVALLLHPQSRDYQRIWFK